MMRRFQARGVFALSVLVGGVVAACGSAPPAGTAGAGCDAPGVTASEIQIGTLASTSGAVSSVWGPFAQGAKARIDAQNAAGGIGGRKLVLTTSDDASDTARNLAAARELVEGHDVLAVMEGSSNTGGSGDYLVRKNIPVSGFGLTPEFENDKNFVSFTNVNPGSNGAATVSPLWGQFLKRQGATNVYVAGGSSPASAKSAAAFQVSIAAAGLKVGAVTKNLPQGTTNYGGEVAKAVDAHVDSAAITGTPQASLAVLAAMRQERIDPKAVLLVSGYDPGVFASGTNLENVSIPVAFAPFELNLPAHKAFNDAMAASAHGQKNSMNGMYGWLSANLILRGIQDAGACPTRAGVLAAIDNLRGFTADGLLPPTDFTPATRGGTLKCDYFVTVHNNTFVPENNGQPICQTGSASTLTYGG